MAYIGEEERCGHISSMLYCLNAGIYLDLGLRSSLPVAQAVGLSLALVVTQTMFALTSPAMGFVKAIRLDVDPLSLQ